MPANSSSKKSSTNPIVGILVILVVLCAGGYYLATGTDLLGVFDEGQGATVVFSTQIADTIGLGDAQESSGWWEVYFTDPKTIHDPDILDGSIEEKLIERIDNAQKSIHIAAFEFNLTPVAKALIRAHERGVDIKWVTDDENGLEADEEDDRGQFAMLERAGIQVKDDGRGALMHNKFIIFDSSVVWTGSTNVTKNDMFRNNNNVIVIISPRLAQIYAREFQEMWEGEFGPTSPSTLDQQAMTLDGIPIQVYFASEDEVLDYLIPLVENARKSIRFMAFSFTHDGLTQAMLQRARAGVNVQGIFETRGSETEYSALGPLFCARLPVRQDGNPGTFHHKVIVIDESILITGSLNFSDNANDSNDENTLVITDPEIASLYLQEFERRWEEAAPPDKSSIPCK